MKLIGFFVIIILTANMFAQSNMQELKREILKEFGKAKGEFALAFMLLDDTGKSLFINENETFHAASTMKIPIMIEVYKQSLEGKINLFDSIKIVNRFKSIVDSSEFSLSVTDDGGEELYNFIGGKKTVKELVEDMITVSSNLATNILIELVGAKNVMQTIKEIGAHNMKVLRGVEDLKAFRLGMNNTTTALDLFVILKAIAEKKILNVQYCNEMIDILLAQKFNEMIPAKLPAEIKVAHKTGSIQGVQHDASIVFLPDGRKYILIILSKNLSDSKSGINVITNVSKIIFDFLTR